MQPFLTQEETERAIRYSPLPVSIDGYTLQMAHSYGFLIPFNGEVTPQQWADAIATAYDQSNPHNRLAASAVYHSSYSRITSRRHSLTFHPAQGAQ